MRNKIEEKIAKFIKETEVSNLVAPELNIDSERDAWLRKMGKKEARSAQASGVFEGDEKVTCPKCSGSGKSEGKDCYVCHGSGKLSRLAWEKHYGNPATMKEQVAPAFDTTTAEKGAETIKKGIKAPVVGADVSRLGGEKNVSILIVVSLQPKNKWANGILENSPYMRFHFYNNGRLEQFSGGVRGKKPMRRTVAKSPEDAVAKINKYIQSLGKVTDAYNPVEDLGNYMKKKKYGFSPGEGGGPIPTTVGTTVEGLNEGIAGWIGGSAIVLALILSGGGYLPNVNRALQDGRAVKFEVAPSGPSKLLKGKTTWAIVVDRNQDDDIDVDTTHRVITVKNDNLATMKWKLISALKKAGVDVDTNVRLNFNHLRTVPSHEVQ